MKIYLLQLDGSIPSNALMRISAYHRAAGDDVHFRRLMNLPAIGRLYDSTGENIFSDADHIYASAIFDSTRPIAERLLQVRPDTVIGGSGWKEIQDVKLETIGIPTDGALDYTIYPNFQHSMAFTTRGCRLACTFCLVHKMEGWVREAMRIEDVWRGDPYPKDLLLLDNDFFGSKLWEHKIEYMRSGKFKVCITQGINARLGTKLNLLTDDAAAAIASIDYRGKDFKTRRLYTAWDNLNDEEILFNGLEALAKYGVKPDNIMVYMLIGYWPGETREKSWERRRARLREFGARPYPMPYVRTKETVGFQRWVIGAYDKPGNKNYTRWERWERAGYQPARLGLRNEPSLFELTQ